MPLYEYRCKQCGHRFERIQSFSADDVKECPKCHGEVERLISAPAVQFKGSGFYSTDYGAKPSSSSSSSEAAPAAKTESATPAAPAPSKSE
jgi:putative FmdB family regulatory protein